MVNLNLNIQRLAISEVLRNICVEDLDSLLSIGENGDQRCRTGLESVIQQVKQQHFPSTVVCSRTIRRWVHHYLKFGTTPIETAKWEKSALSVKESRTGQKKFQSFCVQYQKITQNFILTKSKIIWKCMGVSFQQRLSIKKS